MSGMESYQNKASSFEEFYAQKIAPHKELYLTSSKGANNKGWIASVATIITIIVFILCFKTQESALILFIPGILLIVTIYFWYDYNVSENRFNRFFKERIIGEILEFILPGSTLDASSCIEEKYFHQSSLYRRIFDYYYGNDLIRANYKGVEFCVSALRVERGRKKRYETIFKGVFIKADLSGITGGTYIWPIKNIQLPNSLADEHFRMSALHQVFRVETGAPAFDKHFAVYSSYPQEAYSLLTEERMQGMLNLRNQLKKSIRFSFVPGSFYASITSEEDLLEPVDSLDDRDYIKNYFYSILAYPAIINQLKLYEYI